MHMLATAGGSLRVHPSDETSVYLLLPSEEAAWVAETGPTPSCRGRVRRMRDRAGRAARLPVRGGAHRDQRAELLAGKYRLARRLGAGGMGAVYLARDLQLERDVAVKTLADASASRLAGLKPEARAMATVSHAAVAQIHGVESWPGARSPTGCGRDRHRLPRRSRWPPCWATRSARCTAPSWRSPPRF
ncbi:MAG: hypothetical protein OXH69_25805 [Acidobacteria bacterium]|nr:hypothetical protein [Acidobacteriota bacterium]